jgi:hypothetical protein
MTERVELPVYTDRWMMGDRYGEVVKIVRRELKDNAEPVEIAYVKLDISGKTVRVVYADCKVL